MAVRAGWGAGVVIGGALFWCARFLVGTAGDVKIGKVVEWWF